MNTDAGHHFNRRKRLLLGHFQGPPPKRPHIGFQGTPPKRPLLGHFKGPPPKRLHLLPDCFPVPPPEAMFPDFNMMDYLSRIPGWLGWDNGRWLYSCWARAPQDTTHDAPDLRFLTKEDDLESGGRVLGSWRVQDPIKVALKAAGPSDLPDKTPCWKKLREKARQNKRLDEIPVEISLVEKALEEQRKLAEAPAEDLQDLSGHFIPLTAEEETEVHDCLYSTGSGSEVLVLHNSSNIEVSREKIRCLRPSGWLNDEVINLYLELLRERGMREPKRFLKCHFFNTFFYKKLACGKTGYDYKAVKRWTTRRKLGFDLIECDKIFVPVHQKMHWCLAIINMKAKTLQYLDSLGGSDPRVARMLAKYIVDEVKDKSNKEIDISSWTEELVDYIPFQQNGWDCGMFMLKYIDFHCRGDSLSFDQGHMEYFRKRTAKEILRLRAD